MSEETFHQELPCKLTDAELKSKSDELASLVGRRHEVADEKAKLLREYNEKLKGLTSASEDLAEQIRTRVETRPVECVRVMEPGQQRVAVIRKDTGEVIDVRDMEPEEVEEVDTAAAPEPDVSAAIRAFAEQMEGYTMEGEDSSPEADEAPEPKDDEQSADDEAPGPKVEQPSGDDYDLTEIKGVGPALADRLREAGFGTVDALLGAIPSDLTGKVKGLSAETAERIVTHVEIHHGGGSDGELDEEPVDDDPDSVDKILGLE